MRFVADAQLPPALARMLVELGHEAQHVVDLNFQAGDDSVIWDFATEHNAVLLTKDEDFRTPIPSKHPHACGGLASGGERQSSWALELVQPSASSNYKTCRRGESADRVALTLKIGVRNVRTGARLPESKMQTFAPGSKICYG